MKATVEETVVPVKRMLSADAATRLVGSSVGSVLGDLVPSPEHAGHVVRLVDGDRTVGMVTRLSDQWLNRLRRDVTAVTIYTAGVGRARGPRMQYNPARVFGWTPRKAYAKHEACRAASMMRDFPEASQTLAKLAGSLADQFRELMPQRAADDEALLRAVRDDWFLDEKALWTSGVINRLSTLPYHRDGANFDTWSAMPVLRYGVSGGGLHLPEYATTFKCRDGDVVWFCGHELVHGVTPMKTKVPNGYRFSIVYYALKKMTDCATYAEETRAGQIRRSERERRMAAGLES